jgi:hypothetical protein
VEGGGKSKYVTAGNFSSQTSMSSKRGWFYVGVDWVQYAYLVTIRNLIFT